MDSMAQEAPKYLRGRMFEQGSNILKEHEILVLETGIAGSRYHIESEEERNTLNNLKPGTELKLFREPDNKYDEWAIMIYLDDDMLGYITRFKNETIARLMDAGKKFTARVSEPLKDGHENDASDNADSEADNSENDKQKQAKRRYAGTEDISLPIKVFMVEQE